MERRDARDEKGKIINPQSLFLQLFHPLNTRECLTKKIYVSFMYES